MSSTDILDHIVVHDRNRPRPSKPKRFQCARCQRLFGRLEHLQRHERTHTQERPFSCRRCKSRFTRSDLLIRHERLSHGKDRSQQTTSQSVDQITVHSAQGNVPSPTQNGPPQPEGPLPSAPPPTSQAQDASTARPPVNSQAHPGPQSPLPSLSLASGQATFQDPLVNPPTPIYGISPGMPLEPMQPFSHSVAQPGTAPQSMGLEAPTLPSGHADLAESFESFVAFLEADNFSSYRFAPAVTAEQPMPFFAFESGFESEANGPDDFNHIGFGNGQALPEEPNSFSRLGSRLPSLQPEEQGQDPHGGGQTRHQVETEIDTSRMLTEPKRVFHVTHDDRRMMLDALADFTTVPIHFQLPTRLALVRYIRAYIDGFHEHLPFLHIPSMSAKNCSVELALAMAAVGAQYCFEGEQGVELFHASRAIATERIRRRDTRVASAQRDRETAESGVNPSGVSVGSSASSPAVFVTESVGSSPSQSRTANGPLGLPTADLEAASATASSLQTEDLMQSAQALLVLMAMATWAKHQEIIREALAIQSILASIVRDDGLQSDESSSRPRPSHSGETWEEWSRRESVLRTKYIVFCFFNLHCIVYDIPPLILNSELKMRLPCGAAEFKADTEAKWREARARANEPSRFQDALRWLFSGPGGGSSDMTKWHSSLGNYVLIHAIIQHVFFVRQTARCRFDQPDQPYDQTGLTAADVAPLEQALHNWQSGWKRNPESSLDPTDPNGPVAFNSTALLRLAYIRLNMDTGPGRALSTRDPVQIANALRDTPVIKRTPKLIRALLHSAHALSVPIKIGIRLVAKTQTFVWSIQHSLCSLECALMLSKWLEAVSVSVSTSASASRTDADPPLTADERKILSLVKTVLDETEFAVPPEKMLDLAEMAKYLNAGVSRVWGTIFRGAQTWDIVDVIGSALNIYADMLEAT